MPDVSVIIVTWNSAHCIEACLTSLQGCGARDKIEIIVADNGSADDTCDRVSAQFPDVRLHRNNANLGFPKANNLAVRDATGRYLFFLNPDAHVDNDAVNILRGHLADNPRLGVVGPGIVDEEGRSIAVDARCFPSLRSTLFRYTWLRRVFPDHPLFGREFLSPSKRHLAQEVECLTGAAMMFEASFFHHLGGFDENLPMYFEDVDLCSKVREAGRSCGFVPQAIVTHLGGESSSQSPIASFLQTLEDGQAPWMYFNKYRSPMAARCFVILLAAGNLFRITVYTIAAPLLLIPRLRTVLIHRWGTALALLRWCVSNKEQCITHAQRLFDDAPNTPPEKDHHAR